MLISAEKIEFLEGTIVQVTFIDGKIIQYDMSLMYSKYPHFKLLNDRKLFLSGRLDIGGDGVIWTDEIDFSCASIYECGIVVGYAKRNLNQQLAKEIIYVREQLGLTQTQLSKLSGIDQGDISKIENAEGNPSLKKINRIAHALNMNVSIKFEKEKPSKLG